MAATPDLPTAAAERLIGDVRDLAEALGPQMAPTQLAAALTAGAPEVVMTDLEQLIARIRQSGLRSVFSDDDELRRFYRIYGQRILARMLVLTETTLIRLGEKMERTPISQQTLVQLVTVLNALTRQAQGMAEIASKSAAVDDLVRRSSKSDDELRAELDEKQRRLGLTSVDAGI